MKTQKLTVEAAEEEFAKAPTRQVGRWTVLVAEVKKTGQPVKVTELSRGQCWGLKRAAKDAGLRAKVLDKSTAVLVLPPEKATKAK